MFKTRAFEIGILNCRTGENLVKEYASEEEALETARKAASWFNTQDTFYSGKDVWQLWENAGITRKFEAVINGTYLSDTATESVAVFNGNHGSEHEFYVKAFEISESKFALLRQKNKNGKYPNLSKLAKLMCSPDSLRYNEALKREFENTGKKAMKELARLLGLTKYKINFNPGGIAVSGDLILMGIWSENNGVYISMNKDFPDTSYGQILYRTIKHMEDYTGGVNNYLRYEVLADPDKLKSEILRLRK